ncbi:heme-binding protein [Sphingomonas sp. AR_OL41]|uniref:GlcG/HbpS family heme-binding protein n=1 Tax=Sphingomonas sp. AR_OL41 TaxID=3042729 RepID=UPI0024800465|nr:heme-binding protein [Sphingomonas sp. AR_OL41]MDH7973249.1 heme-binding protein [Sphingomonas sp. AR_OL41]
MLTLKTATAIAVTAFAEGEKHGVAVMSVVITDAGGHIRLAMRSDAQGIFGVDTALGKARTALGFNRTSLQLSKVFTDPCAVAAIAAATSGAFVPLGGGVVVQDGGVTIGAAAVSGGLPAVDDEIIVAAVEAAGLTVLR